jgi:hypothetical protein
MINCAGEGPRYYVDHFSSYYWTHYTPTYTWKLAVFPNNLCTQEEKTHEMRKGAMRYAVDCPRTMMIHLWNTSVA